MCLTCALICIIVALDLKQGVAPTKLSKRDTTQTKQLQLNLQSVNTSAILEGPVFINAQTFVTTVQYEERQICLSRATEHLATEE